VILKTIPKVGHDIYIEENRPMREKESENISVAQMVVRWLAVRKA
jgi:hypothetical protein